MALMIFGQTTLFAYDWQTRAGFPPSFATKKSLPLRGREIPAQLPTRLCPNSIMKSGLYYYGKEITHGNDPESGLLGDPLLRYR